MRSILVSIIMVFVLCGIACAETVCIYKTDTGEVYSLSSRDDAVMPSSGYSKVTIKEDIKDLDLVYPFEFYKYQNKTLITNRMKLDEAAAKEEQARKEKAEEKLIQDKIREMARAELVKEGKLTE